MKNGIYCIILCVLLTSCRSISASEQIANSAKADLSVIESIVSNLGENIPDECKTTLENDLTIVKTQLKDVNEKITASVNACGVEKEVLQEQISNRNRMILSLVVVLVALVVFTLKKK